MEQQWKNGNITEKITKRNRKLKNAVMKSIKNILEEYGFKAEFVINFDKEIILNSIKSTEIIHLKKNVQYSSHNKN